ncbi:23 kDa jasmonate-induced protein-like [Bidens hawaiensis]|uniref:23 kDa jasmonate-induced protein-like n=1 Tax=Bidens hawaiensis TaxID=980011 RepID=UPI004049526A
MSDENVFGKPLTEGANSKERALEALNKTNVDGKYDQANEYLRQQKQLSEKEVATLCLFYNATGETLAFSKQNSKYGNLYGSYPSTVQNGQWGAFLHVGEINRGSSGFVVYNVKNDDKDAQFRQLLSWANSGFQNTNNHAYCDVFDDGKQLDPDLIYKKTELSLQNHDVKNLGMQTETTIEVGRFPLYEALLTREDAMATKALRAAAAEPDVEASSAT